MATARPSNSQARRRRSAPNRRTSTCCPSTQEIRASCPTCSMERLPLAMTSTSGSRRTLQGSATSSLSTSTNRRRSRWLGSGTTTRAGYTPFAAQGTLRSEWTRRWPFAARSTRLPATSQTQSRQRRLCCLRWTTRRWHALNSTTLRAPMSRPSRWTCSPPGLRQQTRKGRRTRCGRARCKCRWRCAACARGRRPPPSSPWARPEPSRRRSRPCRTTRRRFTPRAAC
mmetsp:Transcript_48426/g.104960  ORF Transcript_48426/g.104960 Transcript_48426/m.104960 type:complete len:227 (+) Transcript_48426:667-1347(+)